MYPLHGYFSPWYSSPVAGFFPFLALLFPFIILLVVWSIAIKGYALWHAARNTDSWWFIALLVLNTAGILELVYLIWFCPSRPLKRWRQERSSHRHHPEVSSEPQE